MKKLIALLLAVLLLAGMGTTAYASAPAETPAPPTGGIDMGGSEGTTGEIAPVSLPINGSFQPFDSGTVYQVRLEWSGLSFTYTPANNGTWDPETLSYSGGGAAKWVSDAGTCGSITLTNHSEAAINYTISVSMENSVIGSNVLMRYSGHDDMSSPAYLINLTDSLRQAVQGAGAASVTYYLLPDGTPRTNFGSGSKVQIGTITVTVSAAE